MSPSYLGTGITSQPFIKQTYDLCIWCQHRPSRRDAPDHGPAMSSAKGVPPEPSSVLRNITSYVPEILNVDGTDFIAQISQTCCHPISKTPIIIASLIHCTTARPQLFSCPHSHVSRTAPFGSSFQASLSGLR
jgi:hypothetical protein